MDEGGSHEVPPQLRREKERVFFIDMPPETLRGYHVLVDVPTFRNNLAALRRLVCL